MNPPTGASYLSPIAFGRVSNAVRYACVPVGGGGATWQTGAGFASRARQARGSFVGLLPLPFCPTFSSVRSCTRTRSCSVHTATAPLGRLCVCRSAARRIRRRRVAERSSRRFDESVGAIGRASRKPPQAAGNPPAAAARPGRPFHVRPHSEPRPGWRAQRRVTLPAAAAWRAARPRAWFSPFRAKGAARAWRRLTASQSFPPPHPVVHVGW